MKTDYSLLAAILAVTAFVCIFAYMSYEAVQDRAETLRRANIAIEREIDSLINEYQADVNIIRAREPVFYASNAPPCMPPYGSIDWQVDIKVKLRYLKWQTEFLIRFSNVKPKPIGQPAGQPVGAVGETAESK